MSEEIKKPFDLGPILPMFGAGVDLGERLGAMDSRLKQVENDIQKIDAKIDALDTKTDKMVVAIHRLDERMNGTEKRFDGRLDSTRNLLVGLWVTVIAGIIIQLFSK